MTPERIAEIRTMPHDNWRIVHDLLDEIQRLQPSPAPVGGGVPDQEWNGPLLWDLLRMDSDEPDWEDAASRVRDWFVSRLPALKTGEVVVPDIPADRVLGDGKVAVDREELCLLRQLESGWREPCDLSAGERARIIARLDALRAQLAQEPAP